MKYDYILYDLDGTLMDSAPGVKRCIKLSLDAKGISYTEAQLNSMIGPPFRTSMKELFDVDIDNIEDFIRIYRGEYKERGWKEASVYPGICESLDRLKNAGLHLAVATSKPLKFSNDIIDGFGLRKYFDFVGGASDDKSAETKKDVINIVFNALNITDKSRVLMVGDRLYDIEGAHQAGIKCVAGLWGYGSREEFEKYSADFIVDTPMDVADLILKD